ncbi:hypothetical protein [Paracoccus sp. (in: a-proteobacteria)]
MQDPDLSPAVVAPTDGLADRRTPPIPAVGEDFLALARAEWRH